MNDGVALCVEVDPTASGAGSRPGTSTRWPTTSTTRSPAAPAPVTSGGRSRSACSGTPPPRSRTCSTSFPADIVTDQTSAHDPLSYVPVDLTPDAAAAWPAPIPTSASSGPAGRWPSTARRWSASSTRGRGVRLRKQLAQGGRARRFRPGVRLSGLPPGLHPPALLRGQGPVPVGGALRRPGGHRRDRPGRARGVPRRRGAASLDPPGRGTGRLQGLPARICWLGYGERARLGARFNEMVQRGGVGAGRHRTRPPRLRLGGVAVPGDRVDGRQVGCDRRLAAAQCAREHVSGASWVSIHHGGGVGIGRSIHAGMVAVADGTALAAEKLAGSSRSTRAWG